MSKQRVKEALEFTLSDLGTYSEKIAEYFHPDYVQHVDGKTLDYAEFVDHLHTLREKVETLELAFDSCLKRGTRSVLFIR